jgi:uncharacterized membrane protein YraQ (UPF0718 family)
LASPKRKKRRIDTSLLTMLGMLLTVTVVVLLRDGAAGVMEGLEGTWDLMLRALPVTLLGMALAGMLQVVAPPGVVGRYMGEGSGLLGLAIGMGAGLIIPGGPYVMYPIGAALMTSGAGLGPMAGFVSARNLVTVNRLLVWELPFLGWPFTLTRIIVSFWMPAATVALVPMVYRLMPQALRDKGPRHQPAEAKR